MALPSDYTPLFRTRSGFVIMRLGLILIAFFVLAGPCFGQDILLLETAEQLEPQGPSPDHPSLAPDPSADADRTLTTREKGFDIEGWRRLIPDLLSEQKQMWLFPIKAAKGDHVRPALGLTGLTVGLVALDGYSARYFQQRRTTTYDGFNKIFTGKNTGNATIFVPLALYGIGLARRDIYAQRTFLLAGQTVLTSEILTSVMKDITRRNNPAMIPPGGDFQDTLFKKKSKAYIAGTGSFPSGHTIAAFSVATVYADRYPGPWNRALAYGLAGVVGFSRASLESHYVSEVVLGAALGYIIGHHGVLQKK